MCVLKQSEPNKKHTQWEQILLCHFSGSINFIPFWTSVLDAVLFLHLFFFSFSCWFIECSAANHRHLHYLFTAHCHLLFHVYQQELLTRLLLFTRLTKKNRQIQWWICFCLKTNKPIEMVIFFSSFIVCNNTYCQIDYYFEVEDNFVEQHQKHVDLLLRNSALFCS